MAGRKASLYCSPLQPSWSQNFVLLLAMQPGRTKRPKFFGTFFQRKYITQTERFPRASLEFSKKTPPLPRTSLSPQRTPPYSLMLFLFPNYFQPSGVQGFPLLVRGLGRFETPQVLWYFLSKKVHTPKKEGFQGLPLNHQVLWYFLSKKVHQFG